MCKLTTMANKENNNKGIPAVLEVLKHSTSPTSITNNLNKVNSCKVPELVETLVFLHGTTVEKDPEMKPEMEKLIKKALVTRVITRIQKLTKKIISLI